MVKPIKEKMISDILIDFKKTLPNFYLRYGQHLEKMHITHKRTNIVLCKDSIKIAKEINIGENMFKLSSDLLCKNCLKIYKGIRGE